MSETLANAIVGFFGTDGGTLGNYLIVFGISLLPILELRGGLIAAYLLGLPLIPSMIVCYIGNMIPVPGRGIATNAMSPHSSNFDCLFFISSAFFSPRC